MTKREEAEMISNKLTDRQRENIKSIAELYKLGEVENISSIKNQALWGMNYYLRGLQDADCITDYESKMLWNYYTFQL